jgi:4-hydroxy-tetrahydrodipicolinate synthase
MAEYPFAGLNLALATPFDDAGRLDLEGLARNVERYLAAGIRSFVLSSGTGMHVYLSRDESRTLVERGARLIDGRAKFMVQTSALLTDDVVERTRHAADCGAAGVMVLPPFFEGPTDDRGILAFYANVAAAGLPIIGYNVPQAVGVEITPALFVRLCEIPAFVTVKDSSGDLTKQANLIRTGLPVLNGADPLAPYAIYAGCRGLVWGGANFAPKTCVALVEAASAGRWGEARELWSTLEPSMSLIWRGDYVASVYAAAEIMGYGAGAPRKPLARLASEKLEALRTTLADLAQFESATS